ncbi:Cof-type HAD-IIB family hydrolase [Moritella sp. 5]|uniref:Cof-type HAD-IIB family hydrolase n=1 Tax=Moritella sp. 5 TaxID=2746231 RepID=UPI001BA540CA|nr:Cof-type HAD-IIB family hydrolase [Moritella sp. 5]QUM81110.1 Cof-type HAD-IIB family hydrolase [Moritella sp. 5]
MYKLVALDMDGTLLNSQGAISPRNKQAILAAIAQGTRVVLASGRPLEGMTWALEELGMIGNDDYVACYNGTLVYQVAGKKLLRSQTVTGADAKSLASLATKLGVYVHAFSLKHGLITPKHNYYTDHEAKINGLTITEVDFSTLSDDEEILKVMMIDEPEKLSAAIAQLPAEIYQQYNILQSAPFFLEFLHTDSHKGIGVKAIADQFGINADEVICMGDAGNDKQMLVYAGLGVAMDNASDDIKAIANHITASNDNDGVALAIEKFVLNKA